MFKPMNFIKPTTRLIFGLVWFTWQAASNTPILYYSHDVQTLGKDKVGNCSCLVRTPLCCHTKDEQNAELGVAGC